MSAFEVRTNLGDGMSQWCHGQPCFQHELDLNFLAVPWNVDFRLSECIRIECTVSGCPPDGPLRACFRCWDLVPSVIL